MGAAVGIGAAGASVRFIGATDSIEQANEALAIAREVDDPALLARALTACGGIAVCDAELARPYFAEALELARASADSWRLSHILVWQAYGAAVAGDPITARAVGEEGRDLADTIGARFASRGCRCWGLGAGQMMQGNLVGAAAQFREVVAEADAAHDVVWRFNGLQILAHVLAYQGDTSAARAAANAAIEAAAELGEVAEGGGYLTLAVAALAAGDVAAADDAIAAGWHHISVQPEVAATLQAVHLRTGRRKGLRIQPPPAQEGLF